MKKFANLTYEFFIGDDTDINLAIREGIKRIRKLVSTSTPNGLS